MEHQISIFDTEVKLSPIEIQLQRGSGFQDGKIRIYNAALQSDLKTFMGFLKKEYGIGGWSTDDGFLFHDSSGIQLRKRRENGEEIYSWAEIAKMIKKLIAVDLYLNEKEKQAIKQ